MLRVRCAQHLLFYLKASEQIARIGIADKRGWALTEAMALIRRRILERATRPMRAGETLSQPAERQHSFSLSAAVNH